MKGYLTCFRRASLVVGMEGDAGSGAGMLESGSALWEAIGRSCVPIVICQMFEMNKK